MRTLEKDYTPGNFAGQIIPCCGFLLIADDDGKNVNICGCPNGLDWKIVHAEKLVKHIAETGEEAIINFDYYQKLVLEFADQIKQFYNDSTPKKLPDDEFDRKGYLAFWTEWESLRNNWT